MDLDPPRYAQIARLFRAEGVLSPEAHERLQELFPAEPPKVQVSYPCPICGEMFSLTGTVEQVGETSDTTTSLNFIGDAESTERVRKHHVAFHRLKTTVWGQDHG